MHNATDDRVFLFLQGPHGPFFRQLATMLRQAGATVWRVGFNAGDKAFWLGSPGYIAYRDGPEDWPDRLRALVAEKAVTDIVLYGDVRPVHAAAVAYAKEAGLRVHVFEEGYMRPYWVTYERGGSNGHSRLMALSVAKMRRTLREDADASMPPAHWGDMRQHVFYGALYHGAVMLLNHSYAGFTPHRGVRVWDEFRLYLRRLVLMPATALRRMMATRRIRRGSYPYHLALLQLEHDSSFQRHSPFDTQSQFVDLVVRGFAKGAPGHHHLVFKAHPLEDGRGAIARAAKSFGVEDRVHYLPGGKLAALLDHATSAVTVNSTAAQQALWRGLPVKAFGDAVYAKAPLVSSQPLPQFFSRPKAPNRRAYRDYRRFLLATSQIGGGFYSANGRQQLLRGIVDKMLCAADPYDAINSRTAAPPQHLTPVRSAPRAAGLAFPSI